MRRQFCTLTVFLILAEPAIADAAPPDVVFNDYVQAILSDNWPAAESLWLPEEVAHAKRLKIEFTGIPLKVDCTSPLIEHRGALASGLVQYSITDSVSHHDTLVVKKIEIRSGATVLRHTYLLVATPDGWRITSPIYHTTRAWPVIETRFTRVRCPDSTLLNQFALDAMDNFIDSLGTLFHFHPEHWIHLGRERIDCYLAGRDVIKSLTGYDAHGLTFLPLDAVVTSHLPHEHELVHALFNFRLSHLPMYTLPALQEGAAVAYGGRWGKTPNVIMQMGAFVLSAELMAVEDILTYQGFYADASDLSYALSGIFSRCLIESIGFPKFTVLYRRLSGPQHYVRSLTDHDVRKAVEESTRQPWERIVPDCVGREVAIFSDRGVNPCPSIPPGSQVWKNSSNGLNLSVLEDSLFYYFEVQGDPTGKSVGICCKSRAVFDEPVYRSRLFLDQFPTRTYDSQILGIVFDSLEAGVYDYRTDILLAKFASGFSHGESIWDAENRVVRFKVDKDNIPIDLKSGDLQLIW